MMICVQGIGASLSKNAETLDVVDGLGESYHDALCNTKWKLWEQKPSINSTPNIRPWASVIQHNKHWIIKMSQNNSRKMIR